MLFRCVGIYNRVSAAGPDVFTPATQSPAMHFDQREQAALRAAGLTTEEIQSVAADVAAAAEREAARLSAFFERDVVYSDVDRAHGTADVTEHAPSFADLYTHADEIRGYVRFDAWGAWIADGRVLRPTSAVPEEGAADGVEDGTEVAESDPAELVELTLGPTVHDRVLFAADPAEL